jgi:cytochrome P450
MSRVSLGRWKRAESLTIAPPPTAADQPWRHDREVADDAIPAVDERFTQHTHQRLAELRGPACPFRAVSGIISYLVTEHDDARALLTDPRVCKDSREAHALMAAHRGEDAPPPSARFELASHMLNSDPPEHTRLRKLVNRAFTSRAVAKLRPRIEQTAYALLDAMAEYHQVDLMAAFALPLPVTVICELLEVPAGERDFFAGWSNTLLARADVEPSDVELAAVGMQAYLMTLVDRKRAEPGEDLLSGLILAAEDGERITDRELVGMAYLLLVAGHETTANLIGNAVLALLRAPDQAAKLRADPDLIPGAVEEFLRFDGPVNIATLRYTTENVAVGSAVVPAGSFVQVSLLAANRDPGRFPDPDDLDVTRPPGGHLAFGYGIHHCVGAPLARLEAEIALGGLLSRFPELALAVPEPELRYRASSLVHGLDVLPVQLKASDGGS